MYKNTRTAKALIDEEWADINSLDIKKGMAFKMFEEDGRPIIYKDAEIFVALDNAYINENGVICIKMGLIEKE